MERLTGSMEDYLEAALLIERRHGRVRVVDMARFLGVRMPSVTGMVKTLVERGYMVHSRYGDVRLTSRGRKVARKILARHETLKAFLLEILGLDEKEAEETACRMEHALGEEVSERFARFVEFVRLCPRCGRSLLDEFRRYSRERRLDRERCRRCIRDLEAQL